MFSSKSVFTAPISVRARRNALRARPENHLVAMNINGSVSSAITEKTQDYNQGDEQWWSKTKSDGVVIMSGSGSETHSGLYTAEISTIINDGEGNFIGIIKAVVNFEKALLSD